MGTSAEDIPEVLQEYADDSRAILKEITEIQWYMRGGVGREESWRLSPKERQYAIKLIQKNIENTSKSGLAIL